MKKTARELAQEVLASGLTQSEVAEQIGTTQATVSKLVRGTIVDISYATGKRLEILHALQKNKQKEASHA